jgi:hypothetical protein
MVNPKRHRRAQCHEMQGIQVGLTLSLPDLAAFPHHERDGETFAAIRCIFSSPVFVRTSPWREIA